MLNLEKEEEPEVKLPTIVGSKKKARKFQINIYFCLIDYTKAFDCVNHTTNCGKFLETGIPDQVTFSWKLCMQDKKKQLEQNME